MVCLTLFGLLITIDFTVPAFATFCMLCYTPHAVWVALSAALLHETAHFLALFVCGCRPSALHITALGLRLEMGQTVFCPLPRLCVILLSGAIANGMAALLFWQMGYPVSAATHAWMGILNLLPYRSTDGGTLLFACLEECLLARGAEWLRPLWRMLVLVETALLVVACVRWNIHDVAVWAMLVFLASAEALEEWSEMQRKTVAKKRKIC